MANADSAPSTILIIGAGVFGLSTALTLLSRPRYKSTQITIVDSSTILPNPSGSSVDASRIIRADYASRPYSELAIASQRHWRDTSDSGWGGQGRYFEPGFVLTTDRGGEWYVKGAFGVVKGLAKEGVEGIEEHKIEVLEGQERIRKATGYDGDPGYWGYANWNSGWADAGKCVAYALEKVEREGEGRVKIRNGAMIERILYDEDGSGRCVGVELDSGEKVLADLTVLAAGAWTPSLVDLQGRCLATGQALTYIDITQEEQDDMGDRPTIMNFTRGMFIIPPRDCELKVARHGYGYQNLERIPKRKLMGNMSREKEVNGTEEECIEVSVPKVGLKVPLEGQEACREAIKELLPHMGDRPFTKTRICWYCDTPTGDFLITHHPTHSNLIIATGGSGHGFKFFPVIGDKIVDCIEGTLDPELAKIWRWREDPMEGFEGCDDGSRAGRRGMKLDEEMTREKLWEGAESEKMSVRGIYA